VHSRPSSQLSLVAPALQAPAWQKSPTVQALPSAQAFVLSIVPMQAPLIGSHESSVQELPSSQPAVPPATHTPVALQVLIEHTSAFEQVVPFDMFNTLHLAASRWSQNATLHSCSSRPTAHGCATAPQWPPPSHWPSHRPLAASGRHAMPAGAVAARQVLPLQ
jgi:hypothetical protein